MKILVGLAALVMLVACNDDGATRAPELTETAATAAPSHPSSPAQRTVTPPALRTVNAPVWRKVTQLLPTAAADARDRSTPDLLGHPRQHPHAPASANSDGSTPSASGPASFVTVGADSVGLYDVPGDATTTDWATNHGTTFAPNASLELIFWGNDWETATNPSNVDVANAVQTILASPYLDQVKQYGFQSANIGGILSVLSNPPATFSFNDVTNLVSTLFNEGKVPGGNTIYVVFMPESANVASGGGLGAHGFSSSSMEVAWVGYGTLDFITDTFTHELVESITDPEPSSGVVMDHAFPPSQPGENEICDACNNTSDYLDGLLVQGYWSQALDACVIPFQPPPTITKVIPKAGPESGGQSVTVIGTNFNAGSSTQIFFGNNAASDVNCVSSTTCYATTPAGTGYVELSANVNDFAFYGPPTLLYLYDNPTTYFGTPTTWSTQPFDGAYFNLLGDVTGDHRADLVGGGPGYVGALPSTGSFFGPYQTWFGGTFAGSYTTLLGDVNGDGLADLVGLYSANVSVTLSQGNGFGLVKTWSPAPFDGAYFNLLGDVNGDGLADLVGGGPGYVGVLLSTGTEFALYQTWVDGTFAGDVTTLLGDVNGDGLADLVAVNSDTVTVRLSQGNGFGPVLKWFNGPFHGTYYTLLGDVNGDGAADLVGCSDGYVGVLPSTGSSFGPYQTWYDATFAGADGTLLGDVDGDGAADLVALNSNSVTVLFAQ